jgi:hypothetical protein
MHALRFYLCARVISLAGSINRQSVAHKEVKLNAFNGTACDKRVQSFADFAPHRKCRLLAPCKADCSSAHQCPTDESAIQISSVSPSMTLACPVRLSANAAGAQRIAAEKTNRANVQFRRVISNAPIFSLPTSSCYAKACSALASSTSSDPSTKLRMLRRVSSGVMALP